MSILTKLLGTAQDTATRGGRTAGRAATGGRGTVPGRGVRTRGAGTRTTGTRGAGTRGRGTPAATGGGLGRLIGALTGRR